MRKINECDRKIQGNENNSSSKKKSMTESSIDLEEIIDGSDIG